MAIRNNTYTIYQGKECRISRREGYARLFSHDAMDLANGFTEYKPEKNLNPRIFFKMVSPEEVGDVYDIGTFCIYQGYEFPIIHEEGDGCYILQSACTITMPLRLLNQLGFSQVDKGVFEKKIKREEADLIYEKKELVTDFFD
ncbi:hypothetical protein BWD09_13130 [Neisseria dentiae]|uniref:Uncharacterized protein n=1 Tax=Neisseria dentiae TaxID=194197 RepID=A0A1X3D1R9_9NEIS|nr:hypothetical protein [Neisseria dentiae]OSI13644.1 hypothetical protein BWD09_13130 [Neisseria dentiae]QMT44739.1 hypothetical protein H3L92_09880 [Neisseria dentiae]STZ50460.1 Uncharacterised protein [Neisseria dentiae]